MTDYENLLTLLARAGVEFIVIGGVAASAHGSARVTEDLDIVYRRGRRNIKRLVEALSATNPYLRGAPPGLPFEFDERTALNGLNFTLITDLGSLDLLGEITGGGGYEDLLPHSLRVPVFGIECSLLELKHLIHVKRACGRPKDLEAIAELEKILEDQAGPTK
jgi:predicted nucleotidyltransferase